jgi:hypothetical protein
MITLFVGPGHILILLMIILFIILLPLIALIDVLINRFPGNDKLIWVVIILFIPFLGSVLYFLIGRKNRF